MISIINKRHVFYCGRGSPLGNPYSHLENSKAEFKVATREEAIEKYSIWLDEQIKNKNKIVCDELNKIYKTALNYDIQLECYCAGFYQDCHTQIIEQKILAVAKENGKINQITENKNNL